MADRDPALEAALHKWFVDSASPDMPYPLSTAFRAGWHAALRSLGAGTPEAQAALRALVKAAQEAADLWVRYGSLMTAQQAKEFKDAREVCLESAREFTRVLAALATPTEEGR